MAIIFKATPIQNPIGKYINPKKQNKRIFLSIILLLIHSVPKYVNPAPHITGNAKRAISVPKIKASSSHPNEIKNLKMKGLFFEYYYPGHPNGFHWLKWSLVYVPPQSQHH
jgi:hypothetical protein